MFNFFEENTNVLPEQVETGSISDKPIKNHGHDIESSGAEVGSAGGVKEEDVSRASMSANRMTDWALANNERMSSIDPSSRPSQVARMNKRMSSANMLSNEANKASRESMSGRISVSQSAVNTSGSLSSTYIGGNIRPNVPQNRSKF